MKNGLLASEKKQIAVIIATYILCALIFGSAYRYVINPDGVSQLRLAGYIADGHFLRSVTSSWSPLAIWLTSPFLYAGFEGLTAARIAIACFGAGLLLGSWYLSFRFSLSSEIRFAALMIAALLISFWTVQFITSDVLFTALVLFYIYFVTDPGILSNKKTALFSGIAAGSAYLAHHYAMPFFLAHFPVMLLLRGYIDRGESRISFKNMALSFTAGIVGFVMIASIWIAVMSVKYGHLNISNKGNVTYAAVGPKDKDRRHPFFVAGLFKPKDDYAMHVFEDPSEVAFKTWSPFESREYFIYQLKLIKDNSFYIYNHFVNNSPFFTYAFIIGIFTLVPLALLISCMNNAKRYLYCWTILTFSIYCTGFLLIIARSPRRFYAPMLIFLLLAFHFMEELRNGLGEFLSERKVRLLTAYLLLVAVAAFALKPGMHLLKSIKIVTAAAQVNPYSEMAEQINAVQFESPYAIIRSSQKPHTDTYIAYYIKKQLLGRPMSEDIDGITKELEEAGAKSLLVFDNPKIVEGLKQDRRYIHLASRRLGNHERYQRTVNINIRDHEILTGWDEEVNIFALLQK